MRIHGFKGYPGVESRVLVGYRVWGGGYGDHLPLPGVIQCHVAIHLAVVHMCAILTISKGPGLRVCDVGFMV